MTELPYLGHLVPGAGIKPLPDSVVAIDQIKQPTNVKEVKSFIGLITFYHRFMPKLSETMQQLHELMAGPRTQRWRLIVWGAKEQQLFQQAKNALKMATLLTHHAPDSELRLVTDASDITIGTMVEQADQTGWRPVAFFSWVLSKAENNYSTFDKELTAVFAAIQKFKHWLDGQEFHVLTDHKPLVKAISKATDAVSGRQRQLSFISKFKSNIHHLPGSQNAVADFLSQPSQSAATPDEADSNTVSALQTQEIAASTDCLVEIGLDLKAVATAQRLDMEKLSQEASSTFWTFAYHLPSGKFAGLHLTRGLAPSLAAHQIPSTANKNASLY